MSKAAEQTKQRYDHKANATPLLTSERIWIHNRNRQGQGKLHGGWNPEPYLVLETVGETGLVYRVRQERGDREKVLHRNSLKLCTGPPLQQAVTPQATERLAEVPLVLLRPSPRFACAARATTTAPVR